MLDKHTNRSRGFGFITFYDNTKVDLVLKGQPHVIDGKAVECKIAIPKDHIAPLDTTIIEEPAHISNSRKIFLGGLPPSLKEPDMKAYFEKYGEIEQCVIMKDKPTGKSRGFGFIIFVNEDSADSVMIDKNKHNILGKWVRICLNRLIVNELFRRKC
jgi:heterogeneous nuclear ribonucleoprotein A1/A3